MSSKDFLPARPSVSAQTETMPGVSSQLVADALLELEPDADISVLPSVDEAFGLVLVESLAAGTPVVADRSGAGPGIVDSEAIGRLFEPDDPVDLARAMDEALDLGLDAATAERCRARAGVYDWPRLVERWERLYERVAPPARALQVSGASAASPVRASWS